MDYKRRVVDLLTKFGWHDGVIENLCGLLNEIDRYAVVSVNVHDSHEHWIDGFANSWEGAAAIVANIDPEWNFCGVFDLSGEPGEEIDMLNVNVVHEVTDGTSSAGVHRTSLDGDPGDAVGSRDVSSWAYGCLEIPEEEQTDEEG